MSTPVNQEEAKACVKSSIETDTGNQKRKFLILSLNTVLDNFYSQSKKKKKRKGEEKVFFYAKLNIHSFHLVIPPNMKIKILFFTSFIIMENNKSLSILLYEIVLHIEG